LRSTIRDVLKGCNQRRRHSAHQAHTRGVFCYNGFVHAAHPLTESQAVNRHGVDVPYCVIPVVSHTTSSSLLLRRRRSHWKKPPAANDDPMLQRTSHPGHDAEVRLAFIALSSAVQYLASGLACCPHTNNLSSSSANCTRMMPSILSAYFRVTLLEGSC
jgi:hypothetical protein